MACGSFFTEKKVVDFLEATWTADRVHTIPIDMEIGKAAAFLAEKKIQSAPVVDKNHHLVALLSVADLVKYVYSQAPKLLEVKEHEEVDLRSYLTNSPHLGLDTVGSLYGEKGILKRHYVACGINDLLEVPAMCLAGGVFKVLVQDDEKNVTNVISASAVARYIAANIGHKSFKNVRDKTLLDLGGVQGKVITISNIVSVASAVRKCNDNNVSGVAIVDVHGKIVATWSNRDIAGLTEDSFPELGMNVMVYLEHHSSNSRKVECIEKTATLEKAIKKLVKTKLHRLWIVDDGVPVGCFTAEDAIRYLLAKH